MRTFGPPVAAGMLLLAIIGLRFAFPDAGGIMLFAVIPIVLLGMMLGPRAGGLAALVASGAYLLWTATEPRSDAVDYVNEPLTYFALGLISGFFAHGALGDYDLKRALAIHELRRAIAHGELRVHLQPIVRSDGGVLGVEALARWQHPKRGLLPPIEFIPLAEQDEETIWLLTLCTLKVAARAAAEGGAGEQGWVAVNVSPVCLRRPELPDRIREILGETGLPARRLALEVTESGIASGDQPLIDVLGRIQDLELGMLAIDDFGDGHSSLARLGRLPIDTLKIDRGLIDDLGRADTHEIVRAIIELAHGLDLTVIAEGVEEAPTLELERGMGCDAIQGFLYSRPLPPDEMDRWLAERGPAGEPLVPTD